jgi:hypothetical protein
MPMSSRYERYDRGVVTVAFSRGLLALSSGGVGGGGGGGGVDNAADTATTIESTTMTATMKLLPMPPGLGATEGELERLVRSSLSSCILLENYPRCVIRVIVLVVQANGTVLCSAVNCAVLALLDAGVAMGDDDDDDGVLAGSRRGGWPIYSFIKE